MKSGRGRLWAVVATLVILAVAGSLGARHGGGIRTPRVRPDIVLVVWDTCRADRASVNGYDRATTPHLAEIAAQGTTFRSCGTPSPWTPPAHASLFTGLLPRHHGLREGLRDRVRPGIPLLAETLRDGGYETVAFTANPHVSPTTGLDAGFDTIFRCYSPETGKWDAARVADQVGHWLELRRARGAAARPTFLYVNLMDAHLPYTFDAGAVEAARGKDEVEAAGVAAAAVPEKAALAHFYGFRLLDERTLRFLGAAYDGAVRTDDAATGAILGALQRDGRLADAFVAVTADHGENLGEHGEMSHIMSLHEPVLRVPLVVRWPGHFESGRVEEAQVRLQDLYPTILEAARVPAPAGCGTDAVSLSEQPLRPRLLVSEYAAPYGYIPEVHAEFPGVDERTWDRFFHSHLSVREAPPEGGALKYILRNRFHPDDGRSSLLGEELYDLVADPGEARNLLGEGALPADRARADRLKALGVVDTPSR